MPFPSRRVPAVLQRPQMAALQGFAVGAGGWLWMVLAAVIEVCGWIGLLGMELTDGCACWVCMRVIEVDQHVGSRVLATH